MSNYSKTTNFTAKDALASGDPNKVVKGSEHDTEYDNIATSSATKADKVAAATNNNLVAMDAAGNIKDSTVTSDGAGTITATGFVGPLTGEATSSAKLVDTNDVDAVLVGTTASAVNEVTVTNSATSNAPSVSATGDDTNIDLSLAGKGTGEPKIDGFPFTSRRVLLETQTASASATIDFTTGIDSTYDMYEVDIIAALPATNQAAFSVGLSTDTGSSWSTHVFLTGLATNGPSNIAAEGGVSGTVQLPDPSTAKTHQNVINMGLCYTQDSGAVSTITQILHARSITASLATDGIQFAFQTGNITSGTFKLYGVR